MPRVRAWNERRSEAWRGTVGGSVRCLLLGPLAAWPPLRGPLAALNRASRSLARRRWSAVWPGPTPPGLFLHPDADRWRARSAERKSVSTLSCSTASSPTCVLWLVPPRIACARK